MISMNSYCARWIIFCHWPRFLSESSFDFAVLSIELDDNVIGSEVPDINYFLTLIKHYFFSHSKKLYPLINDQYTVHPDEAFRFAVGSVTENVWFVLVYWQTKANMLTLMLHETENVWFVLVYRQPKANMLTLMLHGTILII